MDNITDNISMKKILIIILILVFALILNAFGTLRVESIQELPAENMNLEVYDSDGKWAAVLIVETKLLNLGFRSVSRRIIQPAEYDYGKHEYTFYMNDNQRVIEITHSNYEALEVRLLADFEIEVKAKRVYEMVLTNIPKKILVNLVIKTDPPDAEKWVDGKKLETGQNFRIESGEHTVDIAKKGYESVRNKKITINEENFFFEFTLKKAENVKVFIKDESKWTAKVGYVSIKNDFDFFITGALLKLPHNFESGLCVILIISEVKNLLPREETPIGNYGDIAFIEEEIFSKNHGLGGQFSISWKHRKWRVVELGTSLSYALVCMNISEIYKKTEGIEFIGGNIQSDTTSLSEDSVNFKQNLLIEGVVDINILNLFEINLSGGMIYNTINRSKKTMISIGLSYNFS